MLDTRALVVDDDAAIRGLLMRSVKRIIAAADEAADGSQAQRLFDQYEHPLVLLDLRMPGVDGMEVLRHIKAIHPSSQVVILSAHEDDAVAALNLHAFQYLKKPPKLPEIEAALKAAYEQYLLYERQSGPSGAAPDVRAAVELDEETRLLYARLAELAARRASSPHDQSIQHEYDAVFRRLREVQSVEAEHARAAFRARLALPRGDGYRALQAAREELSDAPVPNPAEPAASPRGTDPETT
jgi:DNA-binding response OmpR family regulator